MKINLKLLLLTTTLLLTTFSVFSAQITAKHLLKNNSIGDTIEVYLDTEGANINTIDGSMTLDGFSKEILSIVTSNSDLSLWPNKPSLVDTKLSFTGGIPNGISGKNILLFTINLKPTYVNSELRLIPNDLYVYLNNGNGESIKVGDRTIFLLNGEAYQASNSSADSKPPKNFNPELGRDTGAYDGKYFLSFFTTDDESGINHYEVKEGNSSQVLADSPYILRDQSLATPVIIYAYDNAGNLTKGNFTPEYKLPQKIKISIILILCLLLIGAFKNFWSNKFSSKVKST